MDRTSIVTLAIPAFIGLILLELFVWYRQRKAHQERIKNGIRYDARDAGASLAMGLGNVTVSAVIGAVIIANVAGVADFQIMDLGWTIPVLIACFFLEDLTFYWSHRLSHEIRWFWASHVIHHSSQHFNLTTALRQNWTDIATGAFIFYFPIILIGFPIEMILLFRSISTVYQFWIHTEAVDRMPKWFEAVMNTPSHHRVHHATNPEYLDRNYAGVLIIWDKLFGTFVREEREDNPCRYGIVKNIATFNPLKIAFHEWWGILKDAATAKTWKGRFLYIFGVPGWSEDGSRQTSENIRDAWADHLRRERVAEPAE